VVAFVSNRLCLYWHTLKWLKPVQWRYRIKNLVHAQIRRCFPRSVERLLLRHVPATPTCRHHTHSIGWCTKRHNGAHGMFRVDELLQRRFTFLNNSKQFEGPILWDNPEFSYLWDFNLQYFEYLEVIASSDDDASEPTIRALLNDWVDNNPCPVQPGWHPYPISLRTINWVKLLVNHRQFADEKILRSLYSQFLFLEKNLEGHLQVNHLLENGRALVFGGLFFEGKHAGRWLRTGLRILKQEVEVQYLEHGGHIERSPMYHCILLEALLDTHTYLTSKGHDACWLSGPLHKMCAWLEDIRCPDGTFPLFNDAAIGISATPDEILSNAERLIDYKRREKLATLRDCDHFFVLDTHPFFCVIDGAPIGPSYNPGHGHSDNFTYDLFVRGHRLIVDAGTYSYEVNAERVASRSTGAHNTVIINKMEQSEVWGGFRVARRSNPTLSHVGRNGDLLVYQGRYANCVDPSQAITHERIIVVHPGTWMLVWDTIEARGAIEAQSLCRLAPGWTLEDAAPAYTIQNVDHEAIYLYPMQVEGCIIHESLYAPEFGKSLPAQQVEFQASGEGRVETGYLFSVNAMSAPTENRIERKDDVLYISLDGTVERIALGELTQ